MIFVCYFYKKRKSIKNLKKILWILLLVTISLPTILFFVINSDRVQNMVAQRVTTLLSNELGNQISFEHIRVSWFNKLIIDKLCVTDLRGDTALYVPELIGRLNLFAISSRQIEIRKAVLNQADIRLSIDPETDVINIKFIIEKLKSDDTTTNKPRWLFGIRSIELNDCHFSFTNSAKPFDRPFGMDYADLGVSHLDLVVSDFRPGGEDKGGVSFRIRKLACIEKSGFEVDFLSADFFVNQNNLSFKNVRIITSDSDIAAPDVSFSFDSFQDFGNNGFVSKVMMQIDIASAKVTCSDLSTFVPQFAVYPDTIYVKGKVVGTVDNMKGDQIAVSTGKTTYVKCNFDLKGLPVLRTTLIYADITDLRTCPSDIERIQIPTSRTGHVNLPGAMSQLITIGFKGNFTGFFDDFVTYGTFTTNLGNISTDVSIKPIIRADIDTTFTFHGALQTEKFHLGDLLKRSSIGQMTMSGMVDGSASSRGDVHAMIEGHIKGIQLNDYEYQNIAINGTINNRTYDGQLNIEEPNLKVDFSGKVDLTNAIPAFDFWANVERAKLYNLKLVDKDTSSFASFSVKATFSGNNIDNLSGELELKNSLLRRNSRELEVNDLLLFTKTVRDTNRFILRSDILDAEISGQYQFLELPGSFLALMKNYAPAWVPESVNPDSLSRNQFRFEAEFKDTEKLTHFFVNEFRVSRGTRLEGVYHPAQKDVRFVLNVPYMNLDGKQWRGLYVNGSIENDGFTVESGSHTFRLGDNVVFDNLTFIANAKGDSVGLDVRWNNWDTVLYRGGLSSKIFFHKVPKQKIPSIYVTSLPGQIVVADNIWKITHQGISIDSSTIKVNNLKAAKDEQELLISGAISHREDEKLLVTIKDLNLSVLNTSLQFDKLMFGGIVNGTASLSNLYDVPVFVSNMQIDDFTLNNGLFGTTKLSAIWNSFNKSVRIETESLLNDVRTLLIRGNYFTVDRTLNFDVHFEKLPVNMFQSYVGNVFSGMEGTLSSRLKLTGLLTKPMLNGEIELQRAAFTLNYTQARYHFSGSTVVKDNVIQFKDMQIFDRLDNVCIANGSISAQNLKNVQFDLRLRAQNLEALNTRERDNSLFYGRAFATGNVHISGTTRDLRLDIAAKTEKNTQLNIPLSSSDEVSKTTFISFVDHTPRTRTRYDDYRRRQNSEDYREMVVEEQKFTTNLVLDITPDAEAQLIFDSKIGDIMRARGSGNLTLNIGNNKFDMFGTYTVDEGDYLFTLRNVINKKFVIEKGGIITWNGSPLDALINLKALYMAKPSLYELTGNEEFRNSVPVECVLHISNKLTNPNIRFEILMPNVDQEIRSYLSLATATEEEMTRQFLSLLVVNRFYPDFNQNATGGSSGVEMGLSTASEFLANQLSNMLSQWSNDLDVGITYHPGTEMTGQNFGMDLTTNLWSFHMDYEVMGDNKKAITNSSNVVGDFTFDIKLNKSGKLRFKAFNRANERFTFDQAPYTQGIGLLFREDFNRLGDLFKSKSQPTAWREEENQSLHEEHVSPVEKDPAETTEMTVTKGDNSLAGK